MKKQLFIIALVALGYTTSSYGAGVFVMAQINKIKEKMVVGSSQKINAHFAEIVKDTPEMTGQAVVELSETKHGKWVLKALNPGSAIIALKKDKSGHKHEKHHCQHTITVVAKKDSGKAKSAQTEKPASKDKKSSKNRENRKANKTESTQAAQ